MCTKDHDKGNDHPPNSVAVQPLVESFDELAKVMLEKANKFLDTLFPPQKDVLIPSEEFALFPFGDKNREVTHSLAATAKPRRGLPLGSMNKNQLPAAVELLEVSLSKEGFDKVRKIRLLENVLKEMEKNHPNPFVRDSGLYYFTIFGTPDKGRIPESGAWSWRYEGHHVSLHWTILNGEIISSTPQFLGAQPKIVEIEVEKELPAKTFVLEKEETLAVDLWDSLSPDQRQIAWSPAPFDIFSSSYGYLDNRGIAFRDLNSDQQSKLQKLVEEYANTQHKLLADERLEKIQKAGWEKVTFFRQGGAGHDEGYYYRVRGSTFMIEYNNTAFGTPNHQHTVWRDPDQRNPHNNDWGRDIIRQHYATASHHAADRTHYIARRTQNNILSRMSRYRLTNQWDLGKLGDQALWMPASKTASASHIYGT